MAKCRFPRFQEGGQIADFKIAGPFCRKMLVEKADFKNADRSGQNAENPRADFQNADFKKS